MCLLKNEICNILDLHKCQMNGCRGAQCASVENSNYYIFIYVTKIIKKCEMFVNLAITN